MQEDDLQSLPNKEWENFIKKFDEINTLPIDKWKVPHVLGYFCKVYKETYQTPFQFKFNTDKPLKSFEVFQIKRLSNLLSSSPTILKHYIDWAKENKLKKSKRRITSISAILADDLLLSYKREYLNPLQSQQENQSFQRTTILPPSIYDIVSSYNTSIRTYGDLAFLAMVQNKNEAQVNLFSKLEDAGITTELLGKIV